MAELKLNGNTSGSVTLSAPDVAGTSVLTLPATTQTLATQNALGVRNRIINGDMRIDQRNAGASVTPTTGQYTVDRMKFYLSQTSKLTSQQNAGSVTPPAGFTNYLGVTSSSAYTVASGDYFIFTHLIEGYNISDFAWGTANAKTVTLSFWVRSSLTGTFGGSIRNADSNRSYVFSYTISAANTWEQKSITITGDTSGTWYTNNVVGIELGFGLGIGSTYTTSTTNSWVAGNYVVPTGATSVVGTNGATFNITGVQLEVGDTATPFEHRPYDMELARCQRYYSKTYNVGVAPGTADQSGCVVVGGSSNTGGNQQVDLRFKVSMRAAPTVTGYISTTGTINTWDYGRNGASGNTTPTFDLIGEHGCRVYANVGAGWVASNISGHYTAESEL